MPRKKETETPKEVPKDHVDKLIKLFRSNKKYQSGAELQAAFDDYFAETSYDLWQVSTLALIAGSKSTLYRYKTEPEFKDIVEKALLMVENAYEYRLITKGGSSMIFALKNFQWQDKTESEITHRDSIDSIRIEVVSSDSNEASSEPETVEFDFK
jgi:hypothetical protein